jgi:hypothetical protein
LVYSQPDLAKIFLRMIATLARKQKKIPQKKKKKKERNLLE